MSRLGAAGFSPLLPPEIRSPIIVSFVQPTGGWFDFEVFYAAVRARGFILYPGKTTGVRTFRVGCIGHVDRTVMERATAAIVDVLTWMKEAGAEAEGRAHALQRLETSGAHR
jgi:2-aminoethylphosphonate-pyruvate transaminase